MFQGDWITLREVQPQAGMCNMYALVGNELFVFPIGRGGYAKDLYSMNVQTHKWTQHVSLPKFRYAAMATVDDHQLVVVGGQEESGMPMAPRIYNTQRRHWFVQPHLQKRRCRCACVVYDDKIYAIGGLNDRTSKLYKTVEVFDLRADRRAWTELPVSMSRPRRDCAAAIVHGKICVAGGRQSDKSCLAACESYDIRNGVWQPMPSLSEPREHAAMVVKGRKLMLLGGRNIAGNVLDYIEYADLDTNAGVWVRSSYQLPVACHSCAAVVTDKCLIVAGGTNKHSFVAQDHPQALHWASLTPPHASPMPGGRLDDDHKERLIVWVKDTSVKKDCFLADLNAAKTEIRSTCAARVSELQGKIRQEETAAEEKLKALEDEGGPWIERVEDELRRAQSCLQIIGGAATIPDSEAASVPDNTNTSHPDSHGDHSRKTEQEPPDRFVCPITQDLMADPVAASDGFIYERSAIETAIRQRQVSPLTGASLDGLQLYPLSGLRNEISDWKQAHPFHL